jgi:hypothetical protein
VKEHLCIIPSLFEAFEQAKRWAYDQLVETDALNAVGAMGGGGNRRYAASWANLWPQGVEANRRALEALPLRSPHHAR